jgi:hypothetical protein
LNRARISIGAAALLAAVLLLPARAPAQPTADAVEAAFLPKFARYVAWPTGAEPHGDSPFVLCVIGPDPFGRLLDSAAAHETIDGHAVAVRRLAALGSSAGCHLAFLAGGEKQVAQTIGALARQPTLTVTDERAGNAQGMVHFVLSGGRVRFLIDDAVAAERGLAIDSRLLALALRVKQRP